ncbi:hypothetical protein [Anaerosacchariphilus polymeriproducens]|uniref:AraC family transcriptional regulator n=1 Tax=Anaerosacchariphilus polymeriproducens TaxID=1812858 RepID=A0A371AQS5_9FIRM|nr:hypothetical protein [Anaerosacchariphilus polymeriproducens]RDU21884.1 hypothetical protein DWV06_18045 [Anaerosacchariphilus polymeriproducens]
MSNKLQVSLNKALKLTNVISKEFEEKDFENFDEEVVKMENYIVSKGVLPLGPLIQYTNGFINENGQFEAKVLLMRQVSDHIQSTEEPYTYESLISVKNCIYVRYVGDESNLKFAYDKLNLTAFEEEIPLKGNSYTVFVNKDEDTITADVFMEKA